MARRLDIDDVLRNWPYEPGSVSARLVRAEDGRQVLQMRIEMGLLQMEVQRRPDGQLPGGSDTYLDYLVELAFHRGDSLQLSEDQCTEVDREFLQFYHRRICWLALREFRRAVDDADHTLQLMDLAAKHSPDPQWTQSHEQYRPFVLFHRTQAAALVELEKDQPEEALEEVQRGIAGLHETFNRGDEVIEFDESEMMHQLEELKGWIREQYQIDRTLNEQLADAVAKEQYELAARLRDKIARKSRRV